MKITNYGWSTRSDGVQLNDLGDGADDLAVVSQFVGAPSTIRAEPSGEGDSAVRLCRAAPSSSRQQAQRVLIDGSVPERLLGEMTDVRSDRHSPVQPSAAHPGLAGGPWGIRGVIAADTGPRPAACGFT